MYVFKTFSKTPLTLVFSVQQSSVKFSLPPGQRLQATGHLPRAWANSQHFPWPGKMSDLQNMNQGQMSTLHCLTAVHTDDCTLLTVQLQLSMTSGDVLYSTVQYSTVQYQRGCPCPPSSQLSYSGSSLPQWAFMDMDIHGQWTWTFMAFRDIQPQYNITQT